MVRAHPDPVRTDVGGCYPRCLAVDIGRGKSWIFSFSLSSFPLDYFVLVLAWRRSIGGLGHGGGYLMQSLVSLSLLNTGLAVLTSLHTWVWVGSMDLTWSLLGACFAIRGL